MLIQKFTAIEVPHPWHNHLIGSGDHRWISGDLHCSPEMLKGLFHRADIARTVINNRDHRSPLVLGSIFASCLSREQATRRARAKALNKASILWWLERP